MSATIIGSTTSGSGKTIRVKWDERGKEVYVEHAGWTKVGKAGSAGDAMRMAEAWLYDK